jgi:preprotein translocase subunit SecA
MLGLQKIASRVFGSSNERKIRPKYKTVDEINALEPRFEKM